MGTRHLIEVRLDGEIKVAQYGQWDGYPSGQGADIAEFLHTHMDREKFVASLRATRFLTDAEATELQEKLDADDNWKRNYPQFCRDTGSKILEMVQQSSGLILNDDRYARDAVAYEYLIDLDDNTVNCNKTEPIPFAEWTEERMKVLELQGV